MGNLRNYIQLSVLIRQFAYWKKDLDISDTHILIACLHDGIEGINGITPEIIDEMTLASKEQLIANTKEAVEKWQAFGAPWIVVTNRQGKQESFFGSDRFQHISNFLDVEWKGYQAKL